MKIFDAHIHARQGKPVPEYMLSQMEKAGIYGGCVFSTRPLEYDPQKGLSFEERVNEVMEWSKGYEDRIFPILWIHPYEENIIEKINIAVERGVCGFKIICNNFYVYEEQCIKVLTEIARLDKPVFFHSGILWDGQVSSTYNRPLNWEALLPIKGLRFSMGHCSWPWVDECIAMYGKFLNALLKGDAAEMFFDLTPGTPEIYREELLTKLYTIGYDVSDNVMFGTDSYADVYNTAWPTKWLGIDGKIMNKLGISKENREKMYYKNLLRFLGKTDVNIEHISPEIDDSHAWSPVNPEVKVIIKKWYEILKFPVQFDDAFESALNDIPISDAISIDTYDTEEKDGKRNLLSYLYMCEELREKYVERGIPEEILIRTMEDIVEFATASYDMSEGLTPSACRWIKRHLNMRLFRIGRFNFCMGEAEYDVPSMNVRKGDNIIEVHIPQNGSFKKSVCEESLDMAREFFAKYFPEYEYKCFTCHSWLLDDSLSDLLPQESNILAFQGMFTLVAKEESDAILPMVFDRTTTRFNIKKKSATSLFAQKVQERAIEGGKFYDGFGAIAK